MDLFSFRMMSFNIMYENNVIDLACNLRDRFWPKCFHLKFWNRLSLFICFTALPADLHFKWIYNNVTLLHLCNKFIYSVQNFASKYMYSQKRIFFLPSAYSYVKENGSSKSSNASLLQRAIRCPFEWKTLIGGVKIGPVTST